MKQKKTKEQKAIDATRVQDACSGDHVGALRALWEFQDALAECGGNVLDVNIGKITNLLDACSGDLCRAFREEAEEYVSDEWEYNSTHVSYYQQEGGEA